MVLCVACAILLAAAPPAQWRRPLLSPATAAARLPVTSAPPNTAPAATGNASRSFTISNDRFMKDGAPFRLLSGSVHYNRIPPDLWRDRLARARALGLNAVQFYVPWNFHQPRPGPEGLLPFEGWRDVAGFVRAAGEAGLLVLLRPGPYICGEWEFGGLPAWLLQANPAMPVRSADPAFLAAVEAWWGALLPQLAPLTYERGGPIIMVQVENEYGYFGGSKPYLRHLADTIRHHMGQQVLLYTVDGASLLPVAMGSLPGGDVLATVDFGPTTDVEAAFALQKSFNPPGRSPPFCVEYYTGWLTHWGEPMARSQAADVAGTLRDILAAANSSASVNLYMAAGGTNFGPWAGANVFGTPPGGLRQQQLPGPGPAQWRLQQAALQQHKQQQMQQQSRGSAGSSSSSRNQELYQPHITSYDYNCPIGEGGTVGQLGMGGDSKFDALRQVIAEAQGVSVAQLPALPPPVPLVAYEPVVLTEGLYLLDALPQLSASCRGSTYCSSELGQGGSSSGRRQHGSHQLKHDQPPQHARAAHGDHLPAAALRTAAGAHALRPMLQRLSSLLAGKQPYVAFPSQQQHPWHAQQEQQAGAAPASSKAAGAAQLAASDRSAAADPPGPVQSSSLYPLPMEQYGQYYGPILYQTVLQGQQAAPAGGLLQLTAHDTVWAFLDGQLLGRSYRSAPSTIEVPPSPFNSSEAQQDSSSSAEQQRNQAADAGLAASKKLLSQGGSSSTSSQGRLLQLLVWPLGRNNFALFGSSMNDQKGLLGNVSLAGQVLTGWNVTHLCLEGGGPDAFSGLQLPWRPLAGAAAGAGGAGAHWDSDNSAGQQQASSGGEVAGDATAAAEGRVSGQHRSQQEAGSRPLLVLPGSSAWLAERQAARQQQQQRPAGDEAASSKSSSSSSVRGIFAGAGNVTAFISTVAEAQAQAVIAAAADAATGNGPATAAARAAATIRAGLAAAAAADNSIDVAQRAKGPLVLRGTLHVPAAAQAEATGSQQQQQQRGSLLPPGRPADTFLHLGEGWGRGQVWVNGVSLGAYWAEQGPQMSLYLPGSFLQPGPNEVVLLELDGRVPVRGDGPPTIACADEPDFDGPAAGPAPLA